MKLGENREKLKQFEKNAAQGEHRLLVKIKMVEPIKSDFIPADASSILSQGVTGEKLAYIRKYPQIQANIGAASTPALNAPTVRNRSPLIDHCQVFLQKNQQNRKFRIKRKNR